MYLLTVKDGLLTRHVGPYVTPKQASEDLERILASCTNRAKWQIHALESPKEKSFADRVHDRDNALTAAAS